MAYAFNQDKSKYSIEDMLKTLQDEFIDTEEASSVIQDVIQNELQDVLKAAIQEAISTSMESILEDVYPVGSIYLSMNTTDPGTIFGGRWSRIHDVFLYPSSGPTHRTGGQSEVTLSSNQVPLIDHTHFMTHSHYAVGFRLNAAAGTARRTPYAYNKSGNDGRLKTSSNEPDILKTQGIEGGARPASPHNNMPPYVTVCAWERTA